MIGKRYMSGGGGLIALDPTGPINPEFTLNSLLDPHLIQSKTVAYGITITVNNDHTVTLNGTAEQTLNIKITNGTAIQTTQPDEWNTKLNNIPKDEPLLLRTETLRGTIIPVAGRENDSCNFTLRYSAATLFLKAPLTEAPSDYRATATSLLSECLLYIYKGTVINNYKFKLTLYTMTDVNSRESEINDDPAIRFYKIP